MNNVQGTQPNYKKWQNKAKNQQQQLQQQQIEAGEKVFTRLDFLKPSEGLLELK